MALSTDEIRSVLNNLSHICKDGEEGFREAALNVKREDLRTLFQDFSAQRARFAGELQTQVAKLGGEPDSGGTVAGAAHRGWLNLKSMVTGTDDGAIVSEAERGEDVAVREYRNALTKDLPKDLREIVEDQYQQVQQAHNKVRSLEVQTKHA